MLYLSHDRALKFEILYYRSLGVLPSISAFLRELPGTLPMFWPNERKVPGSSRKFPRNERAISTIVHIPSMAVDVLGTGL